MQTNIPTRAHTHTGSNTATNKLRRVKSCQAEHRVKIRHPCPPSQPEMSWSNPGQFQGERWQLIADGEDVRETSRIPSAKSVLGLQTGGGQEEEQ